MIDPMALGNLADESFQKGGIIEYSSHDSKRDKKVRRVKKDFTGDFSLQDVK
jgi:hypothetical protein